MSRFMHAAIGAALALATVTPAEPLFWGTVHDRTPRPDGLATSGVFFHTSWENTERPKS